MISEGVTPITQQICKNVTFATTSKKPAQTSIKKKSKTKFVFDANKDSVRTCAEQRISTRKRKRNTPFISAFHSMCNRAAKFNKLSYSRQIKSYNSIQKYANFAKLTNEEYNRVHTLAFALTSSIIGMP